MTDLFANLLLGFQVALSPENLLYCFVGCVLGTLIGVLPGVGPLATFAMLLPITYYLPANGALIMLAGVYYGAQYGGSTTSVLVNIPGEASSVVTCLDGYQMALQGRAGAALATAALASVFAGCVVTLIVAVAGPPLVKVALMFGPQEYVAVILVGLMSAVMLTHGSMLKERGDDRARRVHRPDRHRHQHRRHPLHLRPVRARRRDRLRARGHGDVRHRRDHRERRGGRPDTAV